MREFSIRLSDRRKPLFYQIYSYFKDQIIGGQLQPGSFLPSIRTCASSMKVSKNTAEAAYQLLASEGYVTNIPKKGFQVADRNKTPAHEQAPLSDEDHSRGLMYDFRYGNLELDSFPFKQWKKLRNDVVAANQTEYRVEGDPAGELSLRYELSRMLYEARGVRAHPEQILIGSTPQQLVSLLCQLLHPDLHHIGVENPGYDGARNTFINYGFQVSPIPLDSEGMSMEQLEASRANVVYVSPSQQFVNKMAMSEAKRKQLVQWAGRSGYLIEDDYEWEYKYEEMLLPSIQSLAPDKVIYVGRISKTLLPAANISYLILPYEMLSAFYAKVPEYDQPVARLDQLTFASYIGKGYWYKHLQKMRKTYEGKRKTFFDAVSLYFGSSAEAESKDAGLHAFLTVKSGCSESELIDRALAKGVQVYGTSRYWTRRTIAYPTLLLGYGALSGPDIRTGLRLLAEAWLETGIR